VARQGAGQCIPAIDRLDIYASWASSPTRAPSRSLAIVRSGWPCPALSCAGQWTLEGHAAGLTDFVWRWGVQVPELPDVVGVKKMDGPLPLNKLQRPLPLHPLWPGFVVDAALYGGIAYVLAFAPGAARRAWRRRRGCCHSCGYDLRSSPKGPCPECGS
jgi:hypothetical protein